MIVYNPVTNEMGIFYKDFSDESKVFVELENGLLIMYNNINDYLISRWVYVGQII